MIVHARPAIAVPSRVSMRPGVSTVPFDNVSVIPPAISDALCMIVSGSGLVRRKLFTDSGLFFVGGMRSANHPLLLRNPRIVDK